MSNPFPYSPSIGITKNVDADMLWALRYEEEEDVFDDDLYRMPDWIGPATPLPPYTDDGSGVGESQSVPLAIQVYADMTGEY